MWWARKNEVFVDRRMEMNFIPIILILLFYIKFKYSLLFKPSQRGTELGSGRASFSLV